MEDVPIELWWKIASIACTDGGYTGGSLAQVSRSVQNATKSYRYQSVALKSDDQMRSFAKIAHRNREVGIKHLFLAAPLNNKLSPFAGMIQQGPTLEDVFYKILRNASPTLISLVVYEGGRTSVAAKAIRFPVLTDLIIPITLRGEDLDVRFPSLRRLFLFPLHDRDGRVVTPTLYLSELPPTLTHLRIDVHSFVVEDAVRLVHAFVGVPINPSSRFARFIAFGLGDLPGWSTQTALKTEELSSGRLANLKNIYLRPLGSLGLFSGPREMTQTRVEVNGDKRLYLFPDSHTEKYGINEAKRHWYNLVKGGDGPWAPPLQKHTLSGRDTHMLLDSDTQGSQHL